MQMITPSLWFDNNAEEAMNFYVSVFKNSRIVSIKYYPEGYTEGPLAGMSGKVLNGVFEIEGQRFVCLDGGPIFKFNESISFIVDVDTQEEVDHYWEKLSAVPESEQCGWLKDKFGVSWQIIPKRLGELMSDPDAEKASRVMDTMLKQKKIVIAELEAAYNG
jgi:predicted 3-demethylubiquinone-9 3-methyltransferase (glyoxalase superfamily)